MDLNTEYLGLKLKNPFVPSSSPLSRKVISARQLEDNGAGAIVMYSLFEEEIEAEEIIADKLARHQDLGHGEASSYLPVHSDLAGCRDRYLEQLSALKQSLDIPIIASLNGTTPGGWVRHAQAIEQAGADALELNVYYIAANIEETSQDVEARLIDILEELTRQVSLPIGVKLSPAFSALGNLVKRIEAAGASGVALFNRFFQPDIDLDKLEVAQSLHLSDSTDALMTMRWIAILHGRIDLSLAATGGIHSAEDAIKMFLCGADAAYLCSTLLANGPQRLQDIHDGVTAWLEQNEYESVRQLKGSLSQQHAPDPAGFERGNYVKLLANYTLPPGVWR